MSAKPHLESVGEVYEVVEVEAYDAYMLHGQIELWVEGRWARAATFGVGLGGHRHVSFRVDSRWFGPYPPKRRLLVRRRHWRHEIGPVMLIEEGRRQLPGDDGYVIRTGYAPESTAWGVSRDELIALRDALVDHLDGATS